MGEESGRLEDMVTAAFWNGKKVLVTGHTGFKGAWLSLWLKLLGAQVIGYALDPPSRPNLFEALGLAEEISHLYGDVRDFKKLQDVFKTYKPEMVFHLAAQSLVRRSHREPQETYETNVMGTVNVLEAVRQAPAVRAVVIVTSDKCYENREWVWGYRENDPLGGDDPYASSKGCAELVTQAYRRSFFPAAGYGRHGVAVASARAGNVIGGGDWAEDRLIPDMIRAFLRAGCVRIRNPLARRPWQHVLEPLRGYMILMEKLVTAGMAYAEAWNFGPAERDTRTVEVIVRHLSARWGEGAGWDLDQTEQPPESLFLKLDCSKVRSRLGWLPVFNLERALDWTVAWYKAFRDDPAQARQVTESQIRAYQELVRGSGRSEDSLC